MAMMPRWSSVAAPALSSTANQSSQVLPVRRATASVLTPAASLMLLRAGFLGRLAGAAAGAAAALADLALAAIAGAAAFVAALLAAAILSGDAALAVAADL